MESAAFVTVTVAVLDGDNIIQRQIRVILSTVVLQTDTATGEHIL